MALTSPREKCLRWFRDNPGTCARDGGINGVVTAQCIEKGWLQGVPINGLSVMDWDLTLTEKGKEALR